MLGILGVQPDLDRVAAARRPAGDDQPLARSDAQLLAHDVDAGDELGHGMLDLQPRIQLDEVELALGREQELERACVAVADRLAGALRCGFHRFARIRRQCRRRRLLNQLLVAPLDRALALTEREDVAVLVAKHLNLDVPGRRERLLDVEPSDRRTRPEPRPRRHRRRLRRPPAPARGACPCRLRRRSP